MDQKADRIKFRRTFVISLAESIKTFFKHSMEFPVILCVCGYLFNITFVAFVVYSCVSQNMLINDENQFFCGLAFLQT